MTRNAAARKSDPKDKNKNGKDKADKGKRRPSLSIASPRRRIGLLGALGLGGLVAILFLIVAFQAVIVGNQSHLDSLSRDLEAERKSNQRLRFEVSELEAPERIRSVATERLGMVQPEQVVVLPPISESALEPSTSRWQPDPKAGDGTADVDGPDSVAPADDTDGLPSLTEAVLSGSSLTEGKSTGEAKAGDSE